MVNDKYVVKYLDPRTGKYEYATIKDVGDLQKLNTKVKTSIVDAINSISTDGIDGIDGLRNDLDTIGKTIKSLEDGTLELGDFQSIDDVVSREIEDAINSLKDENSGLLKLTQEEIDKIVSDAESEYRDSIAASVRELETSKSDLEDAREKMTSIGQMLENADIDYSNLTQVVDDINLYITDVIEKTDFDMVNGIVSDYKTAVTQSKDGWGVDASKNMLSYLTGRVKNNETSLDVQHGLIQAKVGKDEFQYMTVDNLPAGKENMLHNTSDLRDWNFSSAFIFKSADDYRFTSIVQSDSAGENITGTTDELEQGVTYAISAYVNVQNKNKKPNEEKYASTDGLYTATVIIDGDTIELNNVVEDNSALDGWKRVSGTFIAKRTDKQDIKFYVTSFNRDTQVGYLSAPKLEKGSSATSWIPHIEDNVSTILSQNAVMRVLSDRITSSVEEVRETKGAFETATSTFDQMADGFALNTNKLSEVLDKYGEVTGIQTQQASELEVLNESITSKVWKQDINTTLDTINIDTSNRIVNSAFNIYSYDEQTGALKLDYWDNNTGFAIKKHSQSLDNYLYAKRSNATSVNPISIKSSPFALRDGEKILFNFEYLAVGNPLDDDNVFTLEMYDNDDIRVGLQEFRLSELKKEFLTAYDVWDSYKYNGTYIVKNSSVVKGTITLKLPKNGELWLTKVMLQNAGIGTIGWTPSSIDNQIIQSKLSTEINQLADSIELVAKDERLDAISGLLVKKDGKITISPEAIVSRVTSQELGEKGLITQTSLKQTEDNLRFDLVDKDGIIQTINASADGLLIDFDKVQIDGELIARMISAQSIDATQGFRLTDNNGNTLLSVVNDNGKPTLSITKEFRVKFGEVNDKLDVTIVGVVEEYYHSVDPDEPIGGRWTSTPNAFQGGDNRFIWKRTKIIYQSGDTSYYPNETGINITGSWEYEKESVTAEVVRALDSAEDAKELAVSEANQAMINANKYADEQDALIREKVDTSVADAISKADHARQVATDSYNNAVARAEELTEEQSEAFNKKFEENASEMDALSQAAQDADTKANSALEKAGANANLLDTHQNTLNTINNTTIPNINKSLSDAIGEAQSALSSASSAMDEAKKADDKIADYVKENGLVNGTTVDSKIDTVKGEITGRITTLETNKLDSTTYTNFYENDYKQTAQGVTDTWEAVNKIVDEDGNTTDSFAKAVYDRNATRQSASFNEVTKDLVTSTTYTNGIKGVTDSITSVRGDLDNLRIGGRNYLTGTSDEWVSIQGQLWWTALHRRLSINEVDGKTGDSFTASVNLRPTGDKSVFVRLTIYNPTASSLGYRVVTGNEIIPGKEGISTVTIKIDENDTEIAVGVQHRDSGNTTTTFDYKELQLEKGSIRSDWSQAPEEKLGKADFQVFTNSYEKNDETIQSRLTAIDSGADGSILYNTNLALSTAQGNTSEITSVRGDLDSLSGGGRNYAVDTSNTMKYYLKILTYSGHLDQDNKLTSKRQYTLSELDAKVGDWYTASIYIGQSGGFGSSVIVYNQNINSIRARGNRASHGYSSVTFQVLEGDTEFNFYLGNESGFGANYQIEAKEFQIEKGKIRTAWKPALAEQIGKAEFTIFKNDYEETAESVERRLTAIDSDEDGSFATRLNKTESTASGNHNLITTINNNYVTQSNIDETILSDKQIKDTRNDNQLPSWYMTNYPKQQIREFKLSSTMGLKTDTSGTYGILTTDVQWGDSSGGTVKQQFVNDDATFTRTGNSNGASWGAWATQVDTSNKTYQKVTETSSLYERVLGSDEKEVNSKVARIVQTSDVIKTEVAKMDLSETNYVLDSDEYVWTTSYHVKTYDLADEIPKGTKIKISVWGGLSAGVRTFGVYINNSSGLGGSNSQVVDLVQQAGSYGQGRDLPLQKWTAEITLNVPASKILIYGRDNNSTNAKRIEYVQIETGATFTPWKPSSKGLSSTITQMAENINLKVSNKDLLSQINVQAKGVLITSGTNKLNVTPTTTYIENGTIESAMIKSLDAGKITAGTLDAGKVKVINLDADNITSNQASLVQAGFKSSSGGSLALSGDQLLSTSSDGSQVYLQNGVMGVRRPTSEGGGSIGQIGYVYDGGSPTYTIQTSWGSHFALKQRFYDSYTKLTKDKRAMYISTGDDGNTTMQFYAKDFVLQGDRNLRFGYDHYINGIGNDLTLTGKESVTVRANERTIFVVSSNGKNNYASMYANLNMQGNTVTNTSDIRLKRDIVNDEIDSLSALMKWQHAGFNYINPNMNQERQFSVIAQSAPDIAFTGEDGYLQVALNKQVNMTSHALQQLGYKVIENDNRVKDKIKELENKITMLELELKRVRG